MKFPTLLGHKELKPTSVDFLCRNNQPQQTTNMKTMIQFVSGALLRTVAAPVVVTGRGAQGVAKGGIKACVAVHNFGESAELRGLRLADDGYGKMSTSKIEMAKSREQRKLEREEARKVKAENAITSRRKRIQELEVASTIREQLERATESQLAAFTRMEQELATAQG